jgi:hypothetical protein
VVFGLNAAWEAGFVRIDPDSAVVDIPADTMHHGTPVCGNSGSRSK